MQKLIKRIREAWDKLTDIDKERLDIVNDLQEADEMHMSQLNVVEHGLLKQMSGYAIHLADEVEDTLMPDDYQKQALTTITYNDKFTESERVMYAALGLVNEAGEVAGKIKKYYRDNIDKGVMEELIAQELGDVLWYIAVLANEFGLSLEAIMQMNLDKLKSRAERGTLQGDGDSR